MAKVIEYLNVYSGEIKAKGSDELVAGLFGIKRHEAHRIISQWLKERNGTT